MILTLLVVAVLATGQCTVIKLKPSVTKTTLKLPTLPSPQTHARATYTLVAPPEKRVLLRCEAEGEVVECTEGVLQIINGLPKNYLCKKNLHTSHKRIKLNFINYHQITDKTTCEAFSINALPASSSTADSDESSESAEETKAGRRSTTCECGWSNKKRIVGGEVAGVNEFPLMAGLVHKSSRQWFCGGAIISSDLVLTAAHCLDNMTPNDIEMVVGHFDMKGRVRTDSQQKFNLQAFQKHERWDSQKLVNDLAILRLSGTIRYSQDVGPVCLPSSRSNLVGRTVTAMGWGLTQTLFERDRGFLRKVDLTVIDMPTCSASYANNINTRQPTQLCTYARRRDTCQGDSGGPLVWMDPEINRYTQVALVSYGKKCGSTSPAVNTDVAAYMDWIRSTARRLSPGTNLCTKI